MLKRLRAYLRLRKAQKYSQKGKISEAINELENLLSFNPNYHFAYFHLGCLLKKKRELEKAKNAFLKAIELAPKNSVYFGF